MTTRLSRVLLTNDDGIDAPGLAVLAEVAAGIADEVWVVAPQQDQSGTSHSISLHRPLRAVPRGERRFAVDGTPGDCVALALARLMADAPPDLVLSGVNRGANLGAETVFSGTVGAAMTAMLMGRPAMALSQVFSRGQEMHWACARQLAPKVICEMLARTWPAGACLNINFPPCAPHEAGPMRLTTQGRGLIAGIGAEQREDPRGQPYHWLTFRRVTQPDLPDAEAQAVFSGHVSVTPLRFERTHVEALAGLRSGSHHAGPE